MDISDIDRVSPLRTLFRWAARPSRPGQAQWRRIAQRLHYEMPRPDGPRAAMLVTAGHGSRDAGSCMELAAALADELGKPVLAVDAAPGERRLSPALGCEGLRGFTDALVDPLLPLAPIVMRTTHPNVDFLPAGIVAEPIGHYAAERVGPLVDALQRDHEIVLLFGGAVPGNGLALALVPVVARVMLLAVENETATEDLDAAQEALRIRNARDVGLVLATRY